jgi:hypothetical protein
MNLVETLVGTIGHAVFVDVRLRYPCGRRQEESRRAGYRLAEMCTSCPSRPSSAPGVDSPASSSPLSVFSCSPLHWLAANPSWIPQLLAIAGEGRVAGARDLSADDSGLTKAAADMEEAYDA